MKQLTLKSAVIAALGMVSVQALATGLEPIPATGFPIGGPVTTAYRLCNTTGNFGSWVTTAPTTGAGNDCAVFPANDATSPVTTGSYTLATSATRTAYMSNTYTSGSTIAVGTVIDRVWRNAAKDTCIYGTKFTPSNTDYQPGTGGTQYFEVNDIARGGFSGSGTVNAGYYVSTDASSVYRIGRTYTSVQHRAYKYDTSGNKQTVGTNYEDLPPSASGSTASINGENTPINSTTAASTTAANQTAAVDSNWVNFTLDAVWADDDGSTNPLTAMTYVQAGCSASAPAAVNDAIRLRQTAQENANFIQISVPGFVPPSGTASPSPSVPF